MINPRPLVSIAIITYNQKVFLRECIDSVLAQSYPNIEIIIADDYSQDGTQEMLFDYRDKYPEKIRLALSDMNKGITRNSNAAHFLCKGKYIAWMGGDDLMLLDKIATQVEYMEKHPECSLCYHNLDVFDSFSNSTLYLLNSKNGYSGDIKTLIKYGPFNGACSTMVRRKATPPHGFDERIPIASDWLYSVETLESGGEIHYIDRILGRYRRHEKNITSNTNNLNNFVDHLNSCSILLLKYPALQRCVLQRYAEILRSLRIYDSTNYELYLKSSLTIKFKLKAFIALAVFYFTLHKVKL